MSELRRRRAWWAAGTLTVAVALGLVGWLAEPDGQTATPAGDSGSEESIPGGDISDAQLIHGPSGQIVAANFPPSARGPEPPPAVAEALWWVWRAPQSGSYTFATHGSEFDTVLRIHSGDPPDNLTEVSANDDDGDVLTSSTMFEATAGHTYHIEVIAKDGDAGLVTLAWRGES